VRNLAPARPLGRLFLGALCLAALPALSACRAGTALRPGFVAPKPPNARRTARAADGLPIAYDARGNGQTALVFVHCWACDRTIWDRQLAAFKHDYRVVALDLGGHGASGRDRKSWTIPVLAGDVRAVIEHLKLTRVVVVGHSMGGPVALETARLLPSQVIGVVCVDTLHNVELQPSEELGGRTARSLEADFERTMSQTVASMFARDTNPLIVRWMTARALATDRKAAIGLLRAFDALDLKRTLAAVRVPVRCINAAPAGSGGVATAVDVNRRYADFGAVMLEGGSHFPMLEHPAELNAKLRKLLDRLTRE
jgi:pimeloyl-ACP methyl ester carboxylesterase